MEDCGYKTEDNAVELEFDVKLSSLSYPASYQY